MHGPGGVWSRDRNVGPSQGRPKALVVVSEFRRECVRQLGGAGSKAFGPTGFCKPEREG